MPARTQLHHRLMDTSAWLTALVAIAAVTEPAGAQQSPTTTLPPRPNLLFTPSTTTADPAGPMSGMQLIDDLDRPASPLTQPGSWVVAPMPFHNELLGAGLVLGAGYLYGARGDVRSMRSIAVIQSWPA